VQTVIKDGNKKKAINCIKKKVAKDKIYKNFTDPGMCYLQKRCI